MNASNTVRISKSSLAAMAAAIDLMNVDIDADEARDPNQLALPLGEDQAIDAFMDERHELKNEIVLLNAQVRGQCTVIEQLAESNNNDSVYKDGLRSEIERLQAEIAQGNAVLKHIAEYATTLQARLNAIGIKYEAGEDGTPQITVDVEQFYAVISLGQ